MSPLFALILAQAPVIGVSDPEALFTSRDRRLNANKQIVLHIVRDLLEAGHWRDAPKYLSERYIQHNPMVASGLSPVMRFFGGMPERPLPKPGEWRTKVVSVVAEGDLVTVATVRNMGSYTTTWFDMWRIRDGKADEHWDGVTLPTRPKTSKTNPSTPAFLPWTGDVNQWWSERAAGRSAATNRVGCVVVHDGKGLDQFDLVPVKGS